MHYPLLVITRQPPDEALLRRLLAPFHVSHKTELSVVLPYAEVKERLHELCIRAEAPWELLDALERDDIEAIRSMNEIHEFFYEMNAAGDALDGCNPKARWDYWGYGGRWAGLLNDRLDCPLRALPRLRAGDTEQDLREKFPCLHRQWAARNGGVRAGADAFSRYLKHRCACALLTPDGKWMDPGGDAWWLGACAEGEADWVERYNRVLDALPGEYWVTLLDCHI